MNRSLKKGWPCHAQIHAAHEQSLQQQGAILRSEYHRKQQRNFFPKARCCEP